MIHSPQIHEIILPTWLLWVFPQSWIILFPATLATTCLASLFALRWMTPNYRKNLFRQIWWKVWLLSLLADLIGVFWMLLGVLIVWGRPSGSANHRWYTAMEHIIYRPYGHWLAFLWTLAAVVVSAVCVYLFNRRLLRRSAFLREYQIRRIAATLAVLTAPWLLFLPAYY